MSDFKTGRYRGRLIAAHLGKSSKRETMQIAFEFEPIGRYGGGDQLEPCPSDTRTVYRYITPNTVDNLVAALQALGYDRETFAEIDSGHPNAFAWAGIECDVVCKLETWEGVERDKWDFPLKGVGGKPVDDREIRSLDAQFGSALRKQPGGATNPNASRAPVNQAADKEQADAGAAASEKEAFDRF